MNDVLNGLDAAATNHLRYALGSAYDRGIEHASHGAEPPSGPFVLALYDFAMTPPFTHGDFADTQGILDLMAENRVTSQGTPGHDQPLDGAKFAVPGRANLSPLDITAMKGAEMWLTGSSNLDLLTGHEKWPGATSSFGGRPCRINMGRGNFLRFGIAGSGYKPWFDQLITDMALATVLYELILAGYVPAEAVESETFILGPGSTWSYPPRVTRYSY